MSFKYQSKGGKFDPSITEELYYMIDLNRDNKVTL